MSERILVTGGAGFLGAHLCRRLLAADAEVICVDNFHTGKAAAVSDLVDQPGFELCRHDVMSPLMLEVDRIYHLACPASPVHYQADPVRTIKTAVLGTMHMLGLAKRLGVPVLLASTSEIYGDPDVHPQPEDYPGRVRSIGPRSCYDEGKRCAETLCFDYWRQHDVDIKVVRIFNTYGPGMHFDDGRVISNFVVQALGNEPITVYGDGRQSRSFCYVDEMIDGLVAVMSSGPEFTGPVNLGNPEEYPVGELAEMIIRLAGSKSVLRYEPLPEDDPRQRCPDITLAHELFGWEPRIGLEPGLERTIADFSRRMKEGGNASGVAEKHLGKS